MTRARTIMSSARARGKQNLLHVMSVVNSDLHALGLSIQAHEAMEKQGATTVHDFILRYPQVKRFLDVTVVEELDPVYDDCADALDAVNEGD